MQAQEWVSSSNFWLILNELLCKITGNNTVKPLWSGHLLSHHPLLDGQLPKSWNYSQYNTVNKICFWRPPLLRGCSLLLAAPIRFVLMFLPLFSGQQECRVRSLSRGQPPLDSKQFKIESDDWKIIKNTSLLLSSWNCVFPFHIVLHWNNFNSFWLFLTNSIKLPTSFKRPFPLSLRAVA